jgi:metallo-beta-lactamase family protein
MKLSFHGAAGGVTGSCHLVECAGLKLLVDCGMFQGGRESEEENAEPFGFEPAEIDFLLLTHAHLDHCGRIPLLYRRGFRGEIITTPPTRELTRLVLLDSAHIQEEEAERRHRHGHDRHHHHGGGGGAGLKPLYSILDTLNSFDCFGRPASYGKEIEVAPGITAMFGDAGHVLGSAWIHLKLEEGRRHTSLLFSGDLGNAGRPLLHDPVAPPHADRLVIETTYGDRRHKDLEGSINELYEGINHALDHGGNAIIPTFALDRAQEILFFLKQGERQGKLPRDIPIFLDSPMAITATEIYRRHPDYYKPEVRHLFEAGDDPLQPNGLKITRETAQSVALNSVTGAVILAGSGMCTGGRVRHHLRHNIARHHSSIIFVGYAAEHTLARHIIDGAKFVHIFGDQLPVKAKIFTVNGFSAHADSKELLDWERSATPDEIFLVHGEKPAMEHFGKHLKDAVVHMPALHSSFDL